MNPCQASGSGFRQKVSQLLRAMLLGSFRAYKFAISPMLLPACRYVPTCSEYAAEAVDKYGVLRGTLMAAWRLLRCHPFAKGGFDPVPNVTTQDMRRTTRDARHVAACNH